MCAKCSSESGAGWAVLFDGVVYLGTCLVDGFVRPHIFMPSIFFLGER